MQSYSFYPKNDARSGKKRIFVKNKSNQRMKNLVKSVGVVLLAVVALALVAPLALQGKIEQIVKREANALLQARLDFDRLHISLLRHFPNASLELKGLTLVGVERFEGDTIVAAERISVVVNPLSLLGDSGFEVKKVLLAAPALHAHKLADGAVNWEVMKPSEEPEVVEVATPAETDTESNSSFRLAVRDFRITDAVIRYEDDSTKMRFSTNPLDLRLRGDLSAAQSELDLHVKMQQLKLRSGVVTMLSDAEAELKATVAADLEAMRFTLTENSLRLNAITLTLNGWAQLLDDGALAMDLTAGTEHVQFKEVLSLIPAFYMRDFRQLTAGGELGLSCWAKGTLRGAELPAFELKASVADGRFQYASLPKAVTDIQIAARVANRGGVMDRTEVEVSQFGLKMAGNALSASFYGTNLISDPQLRATLRGEVDLGAVEEVYPLEEMELAGLITADMKAAGRLSDLEKQRYDNFSAAGTFVVEGMALDMPSLPPVKLHRAAATITPSAMTLGELNLTVGASDLKANGQLTNYLGYLLQGSMLGGRLYLHSELLDLNELLTAMASEEAAEEQPTASQSTQKTAPSTDASMAVAIPENLSLSLATDIGKILFQKMSIERVAGEVRVAEGVLSLNKLAMGLFEGEATASGTYMAKEDPKHPVLTMNLGLEKASFQQTFNQLEMVQQLVPIFAKTGGDYSLALDLTTQLDEQLSPVMPSVNASGVIRSENIRLQNIELFGKLADALKYEPLRNVEAKDVKITFAIKDGRLATQPFDMKIGATAMTLSGSTGLDQTIDYTAVVTLPKGAAGGVLSKVNVSIGGTFTKPEIKLGVKEAAQEAAKSVVDQQIQKLTGSETLSEELAKQAENLRAEAQRAGEKLVAAAETQREKLIEEASTKGTLAQIAAKAAGDKLVKEAQKQAANLLAKAEEQAAKMQGGSGQSTTAEPQTAE